MRVDGAWVQFDDGEVRPILIGEVVSTDGRLTVTTFLVDTGADRTVLSKEVLDELGLTATPPTGRMAGVGGVVDTVNVDVELRLRRDVGQRVSFRGRFAAVVQTGDLDLSVLGRDIIGLFALIVDRPGNVVCLIGQQHRYSISRS